LLETVLGGGDDYEIVLTLSPEKLGAFHGAARAAGVATAEIGRVTAGEGACFMCDSSPLRLARSSYSHF
jgi:thiamine-monophosphate kinase